MTTTRSKELKELFERISSAPDFSYVDFSDINATNALGDNALHCAAVWGDIAAVELLITAGIDINKHGEQGYTPLHYAVEHGHYDIVRLLLDSGANPFARTEGDLPFTTARLNGNDEICDLLSKYMSNSPHRPETTHEKQHSANLGIDTPEDRDPDIKLEGLKIWIQGRVDNDVNELQANVAFHSESSSAKVSGYLFNLVSLNKWHSEIKKLRDVLEGEVKLSSSVSGLSVALKAKTKGHIEVEVSIAPNQGNERHQYHFDIDQTYLEPLITQVANVLEKHHLFVPPMNFEIVRVPKKKQDEP